MIGTKPRGVTSAAAVAAVALLLSGCGTAPAPTWAYTPVATPSSGTTAATVAPSPAAPSPAAATPTAAPAAAVLDGGTVSLSEWKVAMPSLVKAGKVTFTIANEGTTAHELLVFKNDLDPSAYPTDADGIIEDGAGVSVLSDGDNIDPGKTQTRTVDLTPGTYLFVCNIPGHFKSGMFTVVTVTP